MSEHVSGLVEAELLNLNEKLSVLTSGEVLFLKAVMTPPLDDDLRTCIERLGSEDGRHQKLVVVIETNGGFIEVVERIVRIFRKYYCEVEFIVPNYAYSAGTILVMSGDEIYMDFHSVLGPIDPQYESDDGNNFVPGMGYLAKYEELTRTINSAGNASEVRAEISYLVQKFDPAKLFHIEHAIEHSKSLLKDWLPKYKFKDWDVTETRSIAVTPTMKENRAGEVAEILGKADHWHSHGRGISYDELTSEEIKLKICDFGKNRDLSETIRMYYSLITDFIAKMDWSGVIHSRHGLRRSR